MPTTTQKDRLLSLSTTLDYDYLLIKNFRYTEGLSELFRLEMSVLHDDGVEYAPPTWINPADLIGKPMCLTAEQEDGAKRYFNGICARFTLSHRDTRFSLYSAEVVPQHWLLTQSFQSRIFQNMSVVDILRKVFEGFAVKYEIGSLTDKRNYCVQYRETDWDFASRLMEEEGIFYYFVHTEDNHEMVVGNTPQSHPVLPTKPEITYTTDRSSSDYEWIGAVTKWDFENNLLTGKYTVWDNNFQLPKKHLEADQPSSFNIGGNQNLKFYDYPGGHAKLFDGISQSGSEQAGELNKVFSAATQTVKVRQQEIDAEHKIAHAEADTCAVTAGYRFKFTNYYDDSNNEGDYVITSVEHQAEQSPDYYSNDTSAEGYSVKMTCIPHGAGKAPYRPKRKIERPTIPGSQTAIVVGPSGEEIHVDKYGRVKVQFHWDRHGKVDDHSSCWVRVVQPWAGNNWGTMFIPRIGMEVLVAFLDGDPDQPIITGCVYSPHAMPPYELPANKTRSTIKSNSSQGGGGFNEIRFEDKKGEEQIFIHAEKNEDIRVKNDCFETIGAGRHLTVGGDQLEKVGGDKHLTVVGDKTEDIAGLMSLMVKGDIDIISRGSIAVGGTSEVVIKSKVKVIIEAPQVSLKGAGGFVDVGPAGVTIQGTMVLINSGGAAGSGDAPKCTATLIPTEADKADAGKKNESPVAPPPPPPQSYQKLAETVRNKAQNPAAPSVDQVAQQIIAGLPKPPPLPPIPPVPAADIQAAIAAAEQAVQSLAEEAKDMVQDAVEKVKESPLIASVMDKVNEVKAKAEAVADKAKEKIAEAKAAAEQVKQEVKEKIAEAKAKAEEAKEAVEAAEAKVEEVRQQVEEAKETVEQAAEALEGMGEEAAGMAQAAADAIPFM
ncbi:MAG: type VI secretion system tip protein TssI/VgrG [Pyrinomonadaceae bacterium]